MSKIEIYTKDKIDQKEQALNTSIANAVGTCLNKIATKQDTITPSTDLTVNSLTAEGNIRLSGKLTTPSVTARGVDAESITASDITLSGLLTAKGVTAQGNLTASEINVGDVTAADITTDGVDARSVKTPMLTSDKDEITTEKPVVEVMKGYSFERGYAGTTYDIGVTYAGAVKNGNKLTLSLAFSIKRKSNDIDDYFPIVGKFTIPSSLYDRLVPDGTGNLDIKRVILNTSSDIASPLAYVMFSRKSNGKVEINIAQPHNLPLNTTYYSRYEVTFLLSGNMAA